MGKKYSTKTVGSELFVAAPGMTDDPELARILDEAPTRPLSASLEDLIKPFVVRLVARALHHEAEEYRLQECSGRRTEDGNLAVVRNGYHREREFLTGVGSLPVRVPRLWALDGKPLSYFKPFKNGLPMPDENRTESVQDAQAA